MTLVLSIRRMALVGSLGALGLTTLYIVTSVLGTLGHTHLWGFARQFSLREENNIPTWFSGVLILLCAAMLGLIARHKSRQHGPYAGQWKGLGAIFLFLAVDEVASLHEMTVSPLHTLFGTSGFLLYAWLIPGTIFVAAVGLLYMGFLAHLPARIRTLFVSAGALYVGGAMGFEMLEGQYDTLFGTAGLGYVSLVAIEELMEMLGMTLFFYALAAYFASTVGELRVCLRTTPSLVNLVQSLPGFLLMIGRQDVDRHQLRRPAHPPPA